MSRMRLLAVIEAYSITGPAKNLLEFARLAQEDIETTIVTYTREADRNLFVDTARAQGTPVEVIRERGVYDRQIFRTLSEIASRLRPDLLQTHAVKSHFLARCAGLPRTTPWVAFHHGYTWPTLKARAYNQLDRWSLKAARKVVTVSMPFRDELIAHGVEPAHIEIVHNAIAPDWGSWFRDPARAGDLRARLGIDTDRNVILIVGRLSREKDHVTLIEAIARLRPELKPCLLIVGEGPERGVIEDRIRSLNLTNSVKLTGQQDSAEPYYGIAKAAVLSSLSEGSPNALLEAMAAGVPIVATRVGGVPEIVADGESALLLEPRDIPAMSSALARILEDEALAQRLVSCSAKRIRELYTPERRVRRLVDIYRSL
jgi:glycosyltransferase involved in cell wall biosynthesis